MGTLVGGCSCHGYCCPPLWFLAHDVLFLSLSNLWRLHMVCLSNSLNEKWMCPLQLLTWCCKLSLYCRGWIGDIIYDFTIVVTVMGVCTSLGLGTIQVVAGFQFLGWVCEDISEDKLSWIQNATIWGITVIATVSVISGLNAGIKFLLLLAFFPGMLLVFLVFVMDNTKFLMNLIVQEIGYFFQWNFFQLNFWTDAFAQLRPGKGCAVDDLAGSATWMDGWLDGLLPGLVVHLPFMSYYLWWTEKKSSIQSSHVCNFGVLVCLHWSLHCLYFSRAHSGQSNHLLICCCADPVLYLCIIWFCIWGGTGLRQSWQANELIKPGKVNYGDPTYFQVPGNEFCYDVPPGKCNSGGVIFENTMLGVTPVCKFNPAQADFSAFNVLYILSASLIASLLEWGRLWLSSLSLLWPSILPPLLILALLLWTTWLQMVVRTIIGFNISFGRSQVGYSIDRALLSLHCVSAQH